MEGLRCRTRRGAHRIESCSEMESADEGRNPQNPDEPQMAKGDAGIGVKTADIPEDKRAKPADDQAEGARASNVSFHTQSSSTPQVEILSEPQTPGLNSSLLCSRSHFSSNFTELRHPDEQGGGFEAAVRTDRGRSGICSGDIQVKSGDSKPNSQSTVSQPWMPSATSQSALPRSCSETAERAVSFGPEIADRRERLEGAVPQPPVRMVRADDCDAVPNRPNLQNPDHVLREGLGRFVVQSLASQRVADRAVQNTREVVFQEPVQARPELPTYEEMEVDIPENEMNTRAGARPRQPTGARQVRQGGNDSSSDDEDRRGDGARMRTSRARVPPFTGKESWEVWLNRFEDIAFRRRWTAD